MTDKLDETPWIPCGIHLYKFKVEGGYLYLCSDPSRVVGSMVYVPDCTNQTADAPIAPQMPLSARDIINEANRDNRAYSELCSRISSDIQRDMNFYITDIAVQVANLKQAFAEFKEQRMIDVNQFNKNIQDSAMNHAQLYAKVNDYHQDFLNKVADLKEVIRSIIIRQNEEIEE